MPYSKEPSSSHWSAFVLIQRSFFFFPKERERFFQNILKQKRLFFGKSSGPGQGERERAFRKCNVRLLAPPVMAVENNQRSKKAIALNPVCASSTLSLRYSEQSVGYCLHYSGISVARHIVTVPSCECRLPPSTLPANVHTARGFFTHVVVRRQRY